MTRCLFLFCVALVQTGDFSPGTFGAVIGRERLPIVLQETVKSFQQAFPEVRSQLKVADVQRIELSPTFLPEATRIIGQVPTSLDRNAAEGRVRSGFAMFLGNFAVFVYEKDRKSIVTFDGTLLQPYLEAARAKGRCGEIPCSMPPCCKNCDKCSAAFDARGR